jgi:hypothetical protein
MIRLTLAALRLYASPVVARQNPLIINVLIFTAVQPLVWWLIAHQAARHGLRAALTSAHSSLFFWWLLAYFLPSCIAFQFGRQVRADVAPAIPRFIAAERAAASIAILLSLALLSVPLLALHAPLAGAIGLTAAAAVMGGTAGGVAQSGASRVVRGLSVLLYVPVMLIGLTRQGLTTILYLPPPLAGALALSCVAALLLGLGYRPAHAQAQEAASDQAMDEAEQRAAAAPPRRQPTRLVTIMAWRPGFMPVSPLPTMFGQHLGLPATALSLAVQIFGLLGITVALAMLTAHVGFPAALHQSAPQALASGALLGNLAGARWLMSRGEWPFLFTAGLYGPRTGFAHALFRAHRARTAEQALLAALLVTATALALHLVTPHQAPALLIIIGALSAGGAYGSAIPLLFNELGGKAATVTCNLIVALSSILILSLTLRSPTHLLHLALLAAAAGLALAATLDHLAPTRLARLDWPIETEPE